MPRGKPKRGQFAFKLWFPEGGSLSYESTKDHTEKEWSASVDKYLTEILGTVKRYRERRLRRPHE